MKVSYWFYIIAFFVYFVSFLASFSIGLYLLLGAILLFLYGLAISFRLLKKDRGIFVLVGISVLICIVSYIVWSLLVNNVDDYYIFFPFALFS